MQRIYPFLIVILGLAACTSPTATPAPATEPSPIASATASATPAPSTATPPPATLLPTPTDVPTTLIINNAEETERAVLDDRIPWLRDLSEDWTQLEYGQPFAIQLSGSELVWDSYWCATDIDILTLNLGQLTFAYTIESQTDDPITLDPETQAYTDTLVDVDSACQVTYFHLTNFIPEEMYTLHYTVTAQSSVDDGFEVFPTGEYRYTFEITSVSSGD